MKIILFILMIIMGSLLSAQTPPDTLWTKTFGGIDSDEAYSVQQTIDGGYIIAGRTTSYGSGSYDAYLIKIDSIGDTLWTKTFGGIDFDEVFSVQQTTDEGYIVTGNTSSYGLGDNGLLLIKTDENGNEEWYQTYDGSIPAYAESIQQTTDEGYIIAGVTNNYGAGSNDFWLIRLKPADHIIHIPSEYPTIQEGINASTNADTVLVQPGTFAENINFNGKGITVASLYLTTQDTTYISQTIIDGNSSGSVVTFESGEDSTAVLCGFTITNGLNDNGGGIYINGNVSFILMNCSVNNNYANDNGGGLWAMNVSNILIRNSIFHHNTSVLGCAAIDIWDSNLNISNCSIINNNSLYNEGGAVGLYSGGSTTNADIRNVIISNNNGYGVSDYFDSNITLEYSDIWENSLGNFYDCDPNLGVNAITNVNGDSCDIYYNIQLEPSLVDTFNGDYYLNSNSPCIDAGSPNPQFNDPDGTRADMGAYYHHQDNPTFPNYSLSFDGIDDYVHLNTSGGLNISTSATIQAWVKITGAQPNDYHTRIFDSDEGFGGDRFLLSIEGTGTGHLGELNVNGVSIHTSDINLDEWTNVAATCDGQYLRIYKNGLLEDSSLYTTVINLLDDSYIGSAPLAHTLDGLIDEVYLWNVALSDVDIQNNMYLTLNGNETGLVGCWQFNEGTGTIAFDATSNGTNGTIYEAIWSTDVPDFELTANFSANPTSGYIPLTINFTDLSAPQDSILFWQWDFQNDGIYDSFEQNPTFTYTDAGIYSVKLKVSDGVNVDSLVMNDYITVVLVPPAPPTEVEINISGNDAIITWTEVDTTIFGTMITPDGYIVLNNEDPYTDFIFLSFTPDTTYTHTYVGQYMDQMFYRVVAVINLSREEIKYLLSLNNSRDKVKWSDVKRNFNVIRK